MRRIRVSIIAYLFVPVALLGAFCLVNFGPLRVPSIMYREVKAFEAVGGWCVRRGFDSMGMFCLHTSQRIAFSVMTKLDEQDQKIMQEAAARTLRISALIEQEQKQADTARTLRISTNSTPKTTDNIQP